MKLKSIRAKNLLAIPNMFLEIPLHPGRVLIHGNNGSGKSTLVEIVMYNLYNKFLRGSRGDVISRRNPKQLESEIVLTGREEITIRRGHSPDILEFHKNGELIPPKNTRTAYQSMFEQEILKTDEKTFRNKVIMNVDTWAPFLATGNRETRRKLIENTFGLSVVEKMAEEAKQKFKDIKKRKNDLTLSVEFKKNELEKAKKWQKHRKVEKNERIKEKKRDIEKYKSQILELSREIKDSSTPDLELLEQSENSLTKLNSHLIKLEREKARNESRLDTFIEQYNNLYKKDVCNECGQDLSQTKKQESLDKYKNEANECKDNLSRLIKEIDKTHEGIKKLDDSLRNVRNLRNEINNKKSEIRHLNNNIQSCLNDIASFESESEEDVDTIRKEYKQLEAELKECNVMYEHYCSFVDALSDTGVKTEIIKKYIPLLNIFINEHLRMLNLNCRIDFDKNLDVTLLAGGRYEASYNSFSAGERQRIDVAIMAAMNKIVGERNGHKFDFIIFDEILDGALDGEGVDDLLSGLPQIFPNMQIIIISHRSEEIYTYFDQIIHMEKINGYTQAKITYQ